MENIDKMTMELLMNKKKYNKYISKNEPDKYNQRQQEFMRIQKYASRIMGLTEDLLNDPDMEVQYDVNASFLDYVKTCIYHFETKDREMAGCKDSYEGDDDDHEETSMFESCDSATATANTNESPSSHSSSSSSSSYWGKRIHKMNGTRVDAYFNQKR